MPRKRKTAASNPLENAPEGSIASAFAHEEAEAKKRSSNKDPWRFYLKKGFDSEIIILDDTFETFSRNEHNLKVNGKWGNIQPCIQSMADCPHCANDSHPYLVMFLTILEIYEDKDTGEEKAARKLLPIKRGSYATFANIANEAERTNGSLRGTTLLLSRDNTSSHSANIGIPTPYEGGVMFGHMTDEELVQSFGHEAKKNRDGEVYLKENENLEPYEYFDIFPEPDPEAIQREAGISPLGSRADNSSDEDTKEAGADMEPTQGRQSRKRTRSPQAGSSRRTRARGASSDIDFQEQA